MFDWPAAFMGQVPLARLQLACCARRNHPCQVLELVSASVVASTNYWGAGMQRACSRPQGTSESRVDGSSFRGKLTFATTSDQPRPRAVKKKSKEKRASSTSSSGSSEEETDLAAALCKKWLRSGTTSWLASTPLTQRYVNYLTGCYTVKWE